MTTANPLWLFRLKDALQQLRYDCRILRTTATTATVSFAGDSELFTFARITTKVRPDATTSKAYFMSLLSEARLKQEISIVKEFQHSHLIKFHLIPPSLSTLDGVMSIASYYDQDLEERCLFLYSDGRAPSRDLTPALVTMANAVLYMHNKRVCHRKICPSNIRMKASLLPHEHWHQNVVLCGFKDAARMNSNVLSGRVGTLRYAAPEMLQRSTYTEKVDIWSLVCTLASYTLSTQERAIKDVTFRVLINRIADARSASADTVSLLSARDPDFPSFQPLIIRGLQSDPAKRFTARELRDNAKLVLYESGTNTRPPTAVDESGDWRHAFCTALTRLSQVPITTHDLNNVTKDISLPKREMIISWFRNYRKVCDSLSIVATGPAAAAAFSMMHSELPVVSVACGSSLCKENSKRRRRKE